MTPLWHPDVQRWIDRFVAADSGLTALRRATRTTLTVICAVFTVYLGLPALGMSVTLTVPLLAGMVGLMSSFAVNDPTPARKRITMLLLAVVAACSVFVGTVLAGAQLPKNLVLLAVIFAAFYLRRFGPRFMALGMIGFIAFYFSALVRTTLQQMPLLIGAIVVGVAWASLFLFILLPDKLERTMRRMLRACDARAALVLDLVCEIVESKRLDSARQKRLRRGLSKLTECAISVEGQLSDDSLHLDALGLQPDRLRVFVFDTVLSIQTIASSALHIVAPGAAVVEDVEDALLTALRSLRDAFRHRDVQGDHPELTRALDALEHVSGARPSEARRPDEGRQSWLYAARRIESAVRWLVEDSHDGDQPEARGQQIEEGEQGDSRGGDQGKDTEAARSPDGRKAPDSAPAAADTSAGGLRDRLQPSTIQAIQAVIAGAIGIVLGYVLSPTHQYWIVLAAFVVLSNAGSIGKTYNRGMQRVAGTLLGAIVGFGIATWVAGSTFLEILCAFVCVFLAFYLFSVSYGLMVFWTTVMLALMYDILLGGINAQLLQARFVDTLIGAAVGFVMSTLILPTRTVDELRASVTGFLVAFDDYVSRYLDHIAGEDACAGFVDEAFDLSKKLQQVRSAAGILHKVPGFAHRSDTERVVTTLAVVTYYAAHLADPVARGPTLASDRQVKVRLQDAKEGIKGNVHALTDRIEGGKAASVRDLDAVEELIENALTAWPSASPPPASSPQAAGGRGRHEGVHTEAALASAPSAQNDEQARFVRSLHYIWHINQALVDLAVSLGASREDEERTS